MTPVISIIVPVYKVEKYIHRCIDSILAQTFTDFELILVDDGSPDNCGAICDKYAAKDNRIKVIHQENQGLSGARNTGIAAAKGEYICFVDSDDILSAEFCRCLYETAVHTGVKIAACKMERFLDGQAEPAVSAKTSPEIMPYAVFLKKQMGGEIELGVCNKLFHRAVFKEIRFMLGKSHEDIIFSADLLLMNCGMVAYVDAPLYYYRQRSTSFMNTQMETATCSPDRVFAGAYLVDSARCVGYEYMDECLVYAVSYPWSFVDAIYVRFQFKQNRTFLRDLQRFLRKNYNDYRRLKRLEDIKRKRMTLFARSRVLYGFNAYARLFRVYLYRILKKDAYADGHGI